VLGGGPGPAASIIRTVHSSIRTVHSSIRTVHSIIRTVHSIIRTVRARHLRRRRTGACGERLALRYGCPGAFVPGVDPRPSQHATACPLAPKQRAPCNSMQQRATACAMQRTTRAPPQVPRPRPSRQRRGPRSTPSIGPHRSLTPWSLPLREGPAKSSAPARAAST
jgi:hypothetical protein